MTVAITCDRRPVSGSDAAQLQAGLEDLVCQHASELSCSRLRCSIFQLASIYGPPSSALVSSMRVDRRKRIEMHQPSQGGPASWPGSGCMMLVARFSGLSSHLALQDSVTFICRTRCNRLACSQLLLFVLSSSSSSHLSHPSRSSRECVWLVRPTRIEVGKKDGTNLVLTLFNVVADVGAHAVVIVPARFASHHKASLFAIPASRNY